MERVKKHEYLKKYSFIPNSADWWYLLGILDKCMEIGSHNQTARKFDFVLPLRPDYQNKMSMMIDIMSQSTEQWQWLNFLEHFYKAWRVSNKEDYRSSLKVMSNKTKLNVWWAGMNGQE